MLPSQPTTAAKNNVLDGRAKSFVNVLKTLFDILDDQRSGFVKFSDIEARWQEDSANDLPKGVIDSLRKVTPPNGLLSFERFCAGLEICLLRNQMDSRSKPAGGGANDTMNHQLKHLIQRPPSAPILEAFESKCSTNVNEPAATVATTTAVTTNQWNKCPATIASNQLSNVAARQNQFRTLSMPQLNPDGNNAKEEAKEPLQFHNKHIAAGLLLGPPKPPRTNLAMNNFFAPRAVAAEPPTKADKNEIRVALQNWHMGFLSEDKQLAYRNMATNGRNLADAKFLPEYADAQAHKKIPSRRREPRRHTLQNGIDCNMLKKMKQIESEKEVLSEGLQAVERAREWYRKQIAIVQDKMKYVGRVGSQEQWSEAQQDRIELLRARVLEVNRHLATLGGNTGGNSKSNINGDNGGDGLPLHMNLAVQSQSRMTHVHLLSQLKRQNHVLSREVTHKNEKINNLEREKAALIRELYQVRRKSDQPMGKSQIGMDAAGMAPAAYI